MTWKRLSRLSSLRLKTQADARGTHHLSAITFWVSSLEDAWTRYSAFKEFLPNRSTSIRLLPLRFHCLYFPRDQVNVGVCRFTWFLFSFMLRISQILSHTWEISSQTKLCFRKAEISDTTLCISCTFIQSMTKCCKIMFRKPLSRQRSCTVGTNVGLK